MHRSHNRILTTHVGSLPRPPALRDLLIARKVLDRAAFAPLVAGMKVDG